MKNEEMWAPSKFLFQDGRLKPTKDRKKLSPASRLVAGLVAGTYSQAFPKFARGRLLDMGCGAVPFYAAYRPHVVSITCVDWANSLHPNPHLDKECDLSDDLPFDDGSFDTILLSDVLEHLPEPAQCWREMSRLLAPGGKILLNVPFFYALHEQPHDYYRYTEHALRRFVERAGLEMIELKPVGGAFEILADIVSKLMLGLPGGHWPAGWTQSVAGAFARTGLGKRIATATAAYFPFGYFLVASKPAGHQR